MGKLFGHNTVAADFTVLEFSEYRFCLHRVWCWPLERVQVSVQSNFWWMSASGFCLLSHTPPDRILSSSLSHNFLFHYYQLKSFSSQTFSYENQVNYYTLKRNHCLSQGKLQLLKCSWRFGLRRGHWYWLERPLGGLVDLRGAALAQVVCRTTWGGFVCAWSRLSAQRLIYTWNTVLLARISLRCLEINAFQVPLVLAIPGAQIFMNHVCYFPRIKKVYLCPLSSNPNLRLLWQWLSMRFVEILAVLWAVSTQMGTPFYLVWNHGWGLTTNLTELYGAWCHPSPQRGHPFPQCAVPGWLMLCWQVTICCFTSWKCFLTCTLFHWWYYILSWDSLV